MHQFKLCRKVFVDIDPRPPKKMQLFVKLREAGPPFMKYLRRRNQANLKTCFMNPDAVFDILS